MAHEQEEIPVVTEEATNTITGKPSETKNKCDQFVQDSANEDFVYGPSA